MNPHDEQKLERMIHQTVRSLPSRRAPRTLEARVMAELERRAALPWWKKSFVHWPSAVRALFVIASAGFVKVALMAVIWVMAGFDPAQFREVFAPQYAWVDASLTIARVMGDLVDTVFRSIPSLWLYGTVAVISALYFTLFGLGTAAYRALYVHR